MPPVLVTPAAALWDTWLLPDRSNGLSWLDWAWRASDPFPTMPANPLAAGNFDKAALASAGVALGIGRKGLFQNQPHHFPVVRSGVFSMLELIDPELPLRDDPLDQITHRNHADAPVAFQDTENSNRVLDQSQPWFPGSSGQDLL